MNNKYQGMGLVALVMVIVSIGILIVIVVPKYIELSSNANFLKTKKYAHELSRASLANYSLRKSYPDKGISVSNCVEVPNTLSGKKPKSFTIISTNIDADSRATCILNGPGSTIAMFTAVGID